jgi:Phosphotransferase enzyme family
MSKNIVNGCIGRSSQTLATCSSCFTPSRLSNFDLHQPSILLAKESWRCFRLPLNVSMLMPKSDATFSCPRHIQKKRPRLEEFGHTTPHKNCLTHNDLDLLNVSLDDNSRLSGIIDWGCTAWLPEYWDYTQSNLLPYIFLLCLDAPHRRGFWVLA